MPRPRVIVCNPSYGNNPLLRTTETALALSDLLGGGIAVVVPDLYGPRQARILAEQFGDDAPIIIDAEFGEILRPLLFDGVSFTQFLEHWLGSVEETNAAADALLRSRYDIVCVVARAALLDLTVAPAYAYGWGRVARLWQAAAEEPAMGIDAALLRACAARMATLEARMRLHCVNVPGPFEPQGAEIAIPLDASLLSTDLHLTEPSTYVTVSGITEASSLEAIANALALPLVANDPARVAGAMQATPGILTDPLVRAHVARAGWGSIGRSIAAGVPMIVPPYVPDEDPEIFFNVRRLEELGIAVVAQGQSREVLLAGLDAARPRIAQLRTVLAERFEKQEGYRLVARRIADDLLQRDKRGG